MVIVLRRYVVPGKKRERQHQCKAKYSYFESNSLYMLEPVRCHLL